MHIDRAGPAGIDPDPFTVAAVWIAGAALVLQFLQTIKAYDEPPAATSGALSVRYNRLQQLEDTILDLERDLTQLSRIVERGSNEPDKEFYEVGFKISLGVLELDGRWHQEFSSKLATAFQKVGALSLHINNLIAQDANAATTIGTALQRDLEGSAARINELIHNSAPNRLLIAECRATLDACRRAVTELLDERRN